MINFSVTNRSVTHFKHIALGLLIVGAVLLISDVTFKIFFQIQIIVGYRKMCY